MPERRAEAGVATAIGRAYSPGVQATRSDPKLKSMGLEVQKEYTILQSEPVGDFVQMELSVDGQALPPILGNREDALAEIMVEIAEDE